jgi:hypothetical protein
MPLRREAVGASAGRPRENGQPVEGVRPMGDYVLPCSPPRALSLRLTLEIEAGVRGDWQMRPIANANAPTSLSSLLLLGLHRNGESTDHVDPRRARTAWSKKGDDPRSPSEREPSPGRSLPRFRQGAA